MYSLFFNHLNLPLAKVVLMLFLSKMISIYRCKSWEKLQWSQFTASKSLKKVQSFRFIFSKTCKNVTIFFQSTQFTTSQHRLFWDREGKNHLDSSQAKFAKNAISESKIKNISLNHIHDLSKQLVIKARNLKLWFSTGFSIQILVQNLWYRAAPYLR